MNKKVTHLSSKKRAHARLNSFSRQIEVTFHEVRIHLDVEIQWQWADLSILRITPALLGLFFLVTLLAHLHAQRHKQPVQQTAWHPKKLPTSLMHSL